MADGRIVAEGPPIDVVTADLVEKVFGLACVIVTDPEPAHPWWCPPDRRTRHATTALMCGS
jgi:iron complex transport system ATP-binding protein